MATPFPTREPLATNSGNMPTTGAATNITRREFLQSLIAVLIPVACSNEKNHALVRTLEAQVLAKREKFARDYLTDPNLNPEKIEKAIDLFVQNEFVRYQRERPGIVSPDYPTFEATVYKPFMNRLSSSFNVRQTETNPADPTNSDTQKFGTPSVALIANVKQALHDQIGNEQYYLGTSNNIIDPMKTDAMQCRSGSRLLLLALYQNVSDMLQPDEQLIVIYSNTHMQIGLLTAEKRVIAFEMTKSGKGIQDLGPIEKITSAVMILDAGHDLVQAAINRKAHPKQSVLLNTVPDRYTYLDQIFNKTSEFGGGGIMPLHWLNFRHGIGGSKTGTTDQYGFGDGRVEIPIGRKPITATDYLPSNLSTSSETERSGTPGSSRNPNGVYDTLKSAEDVMDVEFSKLLTTEEKLSIAAFEQHSSALSPDLNGIKLSYDRILNELSYDRILNEREAYIESELQKILDIVNRLTTYLNENGIDEKHRAYEAALRAFHARHPECEISFLKNPRDYLREVLGHLKQLRRQ